jgi:hypothetical protein
MSRGVVGVLHNVVDSAFASLESAFCPANQIVDLLCGLLGSFANEVDADRGARGVAVVDGITGKRCVQRAGVFVAVGFGCGEGVGGGIEPPRPREDKAIGGLAVGKKVKSRFSFDADSVDAAR